MARLQSTEAGSGSGELLRRAAFRAMGTSCEIQYVAPQGEAQALAFEQRAIGWVTAFENKFSRFRDDSLVTRINAGAGSRWVEIDREMEAMLDLCGTLYSFSGGVLDPTILPLLRVWNYQAGQPRVPSDEEVEAARALVGWPKLQRAPGRVLLPEPGMALDFGGFGKEYAVDFVAWIAREHGITSALVDFGHDLFATGNPPGRERWHIGLEDPKAPGSIAGSMMVTGRGVASSGDYLRCFRAAGRRYGHIVDVRTGRPVANGCLQATVVAPTCLFAGALSTTAFVLGLPKGIELIESCVGAEGFLITEHVRAQTRGYFNYAAL